jgi:hypothetical protein
MYELFNIIERHGIVGSRDMMKVGTLPAKKIEKLHHDLFDHIYDEQNKRIWGESSPAADTFSFHAGASLRGASGCGSVECVGNKLQFVGRYAALYASELTFPLTMERPQSHQHISEVRDWLAHDLFALLLLRPLITGKVIVPVVMRSQHCVHEVEIIEQTTEMVHGFSQATAKDLLPEFQLLYQRPDKSPNGLPSIYLNAPKEYIEHGGLARSFDEVPEWLPKTGRFDKNGMMEVRGPHKKHMVTELFANIADNMTFYLAYGLKRKARFLSDMRGETEFLEWFNHDEELTAKSLALRELQHSVPVLLDLPFATILRIRKQEKDAFESYRDTVTTISANILAANKKVSKKLAHEMFRDAVEPKLRKMKREIKTYQKVRRRQVFGGIAAMAAGVLIGAYAGLPPLTAVPVAGLGTFVGGRLLAKAAEVACEHGPELRQKNDLYFLLKLTEEAG